MNKSTIINHLQKCADPKSFQKNRYVKSIPLWWISETSKLSQSALKVSLAIWYRFGLMRGSNPIMLNTNDCEIFNIDHNAKSRGLTELEKAGMVKVERKKGKFPTITILAKI